MGNDLPDGTKKITIAYNGGFVGLEELAVRIRTEGVVPYNMLGNVFMVEDFAYDLNNWTTATAGAGSSAQIQTTYYMTMGQCLVLVCDSADSAYARATRLLPHLGNKKYGFSCGLAHPSGVGGKFTFEIGFQTMTQITEAIVKVEPETDGVYIYQGAGVYTKIVTLTTGELNQLYFNLILLTVDLETGFYDKLIWNDTEYDISIYSMVVTVAAQQQKAIRVRLENAEYNDIGGSVYVDNVCAARNVPD